MKFEDLTADTVATHAPKWAEVADCYGITHTALLKMAKKYRMSLENLTNPEVVRDTLLKYGDRRGVLVRRLSNPKIMDAVWDDLLELEYYPL